MVTKLSDILEYQKKFYEKKTVANISFLEAIDQVETKMTKEVSSFKLISNKISTLVEKKTGSVAMRRLSFNKKSGKIFFIFLFF